MQTPSHGLLSFKLNKGWLADVRHIPSPNFDQRPDGVVVDLVVIHAISLPAGCYGGDDIADLFTNQLSADRHPDYVELCDIKVSAHVLIRRDGSVIQFVGFNQRAWHAGESCFEGASQCNDFSLGIELEGCDHEVFDDAQYASLGILLNGLMSYYPSLSEERIVGHSDIAPSRKTDPGPNFEWPRLMALLALKRVTGDNE